MATRHLVTQACQSYSCLPRHLLRTFSAGVTRPPLATSDVMFYQSGEKIKEPKFVKYNSSNIYLYDHTPILSLAPTRLTTLPNGLRVATESSSSAKTSTVGVWIDAGSRYDDSHGTAHFLQQLITRQLKEEIENVGGFSNAKTSREHTAYYAKVLDQDVPRVLDHLSNILQYPDFDDLKIEQERNVILRQIQEVEGHTEEVFFDHLHFTAFQRGPLGRTVTGPAEKVKTITKEDLRNYMSTHYTAPRMVIVASGAVKHQQIVEQVKSLFTKLSHGSTASTELIAKEPAIFTGSEFRNVDADVTLAQFAVSFKGASWTDPDSTALMVMQAMLGSYTKHTKILGVGEFKISNLVQELYVDNMAESMMPFNINYKDTGLFGVYATAKPDYLGVLPRAIMSALCKFYYAISLGDVVLARNQLKSSLLLRIDGTSHVVEDLGGQLLTYGRRIPCTEMFARIDAVDCKTIRRVADRFLLDKDIVVAAVGPIQGLPDYKWFRRQTYWQKC